MCTFTPKLNEIVRFLIKIECLRSFVWTMERYELKTDSYECITLAEQNRKTKTIDLLVFGGIFWATYLKTRHREVWHICMKLIVRSVYTVEEKEAQWLSMSATLSSHCLLTSLLWHFYPHHCTKIALAHQLVGQRVPRSVLVKDTYHGFRPGPWSGCIYRRQLIYVFLSNWCFYLSLPLSLKKSMKKYPPVRIITTILGNATKTRYFLLLKPVISSVLIFGPTKF